MNRHSEKINISVNSVVIRKVEQEFSELDGEVIMLSLKKGEYYALNSVASAIWNLIGEPVKVETLITSLMKEYDVEYEKCKEDTLKCLQDFNERSLLEIINA